MRQRVTKDGHHGNKIQIDDDCRSAKCIHADLHQIQCPPSRFADPDVCQEKSDQQDKDDPGDRCLFKIRLQSGPKLLERIDHSVSPERPEHDIIKSGKSGTNRKKRYAEQHEHNIGGNNDAELRHESAEEAVIIQKALYQIVHYLPPKNYINMRQITA